MTEKLRIIPLAGNPRRKKKKAKRARRSLVSKRTIKREWIVEVLHLHGKTPSFFFHTGSGLTKDRRKAQCFKTEKAARAAAKKIIAALPSAYRGARAVPA